MASLSELNDSFNTRSFQNISTHHPTTENRLTAMSKASKLSSIVSETKTPRQKGVREKTRREILMEQEFIRKNGINRILCRMKTLFSGRRYLVERLNEPMTTLDDCLVSINLENNLMSEQQLYELNPITIFLEKISELPNKPIEFQTLREMCTNVYCSYKFFEQPLYKTPSVLHNSDIYFNDTNVYLAGPLSKPDLHEFIHASLFEIQVHDRDRKPIQISPTIGGSDLKINNQSLIKSNMGNAILKPCLFGNDPSIDERISNVNSIASKHTQHNPFERIEKRWDNYGVARLDLHEFALGKRLIEFYVPVLPCSAPDVLAKHTPNQKLAYQKLVSSDDEKAVPCGAYLESNTHLCVRISVARPLFDENSVDENSKSIEQQKVY